jgi:putative transposase
MPNDGCRNVATTFNRIAVARHWRDGEVTASVSKTYVADVVRNHRYAIDVLRRELKHKMPHSPPRNAVWGVDMTGRQDAHGNVHHIFGIVDHGSRLSIALERVERMDTWMFLSHLFRAISVHGKPHAIRTDKASVFRSRLFAAVMRLAGIKHQFTDVGSPWQNGRIERLFGTLKSKLNQVIISDGMKLDAALAHFRLWYNKVRPHQHLRGATPLEAWTGKPLGSQKIKGIEFFTAWDGLLTGFHMRR